MPSAPITSESLLISDRGWTTARSEPTVTFGADRHGQIVSRPVFIKALNKSAQPVFVGTDAALGPFVPESMLITKPGLALTARALVEFGDVSDVWFENVVGLPSNIRRPDSNLLIAALMQSAPFISADRFARRCVSHGEELKGALSPTCNFYNISTESFCIFDCKALQSLPEMSWAFVINLLTALCENAEDDSLMFSTDDAAPALWYCSALLACKKQYQITYDSLQHSLFANVRQVIDQQSPFKNARCAYLESLSRGCMEIRWDDGSWSPIINGFLLRGT